MKIVICLFLAAAALGTILFARRYSQKDKSWAHEPQQFLGIALGKPISESLPQCRGIEDKLRCFDAEDSTAENVTDVYGLVSVILKHKLVQGITVSISVLNVDLAYKDLTERYGPPTNHESENEELWIGKHVSIRLLRPIDLDHSGAIMVWDTDIPDDPAPAHTNTF